MKLSWRTEWPHWLVLAALFVFPAVTWHSAPERIPVHWGLDFRVDRYGGRFEGLLALPLTALALYALMAFLPRIDPGRANYERFARPYAMLRLAALLFLAGLYGAIQLSLRGRLRDLGAAAALFAGVLFIVVGNIFGKIRPNWFVGIRTPWTLSSKLAWTRTHRAGRWLFIAAGVLFIAVAFVRAAWATWVALAVLGIWIVGLIVYSYVVWRGDPDRTPPAGTLPA